MSEKYRKFGLRRDKNLSDLPNKELALINLLEGLSTGGNGFLPGDIFAINGLSNTPVTNEDLRELDGLVRRYSPIAGGAAENLEPIPRIQDNIENFRGELGNPPYIVGGDGPKAYFIPIGEVSSDPFTKTTTGGDIHTLTTESDGTPNLSGDVVGPEFFWNTGAFEFGTKLYSTFDDDYGAIQWVGYLSTIASLRFITEGLLFVEQDYYDDDNWTLLKSVYDYDRTISIASSVYDGSSSTVLGVGTDIKHVNINDVVSPGSGDYIVRSIDYTNSTVTVDGDASSIGASATFSFSPTANEPYDTGKFNTLDVSILDKVKTRITVVYPSSETYQDKTLTIDGTGRLGLGEGVYLPYNYFYSESTSSQTPTLYDFKYFYENRIDGKNQSIPSDVHIQTTDNFTINYTPQTTFSNNLRYTGNVRTMDIFGRGTAQSSNQFNDVEVGDWLVFIVDTTDYYLVQVKEKRNGDTIFFDDSINLSDKPSIEFVVFKNTGLVGVYKLNTDNTTSVIFEQMLGDGQSLSDVKIDNFLALVKPGSPITHNASPFRVTSWTDLGNDTVEVDIDDFTGSAGTLASPEFVAVYSHTGLHELSGEASCAGVYGLEVTSLVSNNTNTITVTSTADVTTGDYIQYGSSIPDSTTVTVANSTVITLSANTTAEIPSGGTIVLMASDPSATNKEFCVLPLNTAPPFEGTNLGLRTTVSFPDLSAQKLTFRDIEMFGMTSTVITTETNYANTVAITHGGNTYKLLLE